MQDGRAAAHPPAGEHFNVPAIQYVEWAGDLRSSKGEGTSIPRPVTPRGKVGGNEVQEWMNACKFLAPPSIEQGRRTHEMENILSDVYFQVGMCFS